MKISSSFLALTLTTLLGLSFLPSQSRADDTSVTEKAKELGHDAKRGTGKAVRKAKDETCSLVNGKMECAAKKVKHSVENGADKVKDAAD